MAYKQLVTPNWWAQEQAGNCLPLAQKVVGAGGGPVSATQAANETRFRHYNRDFPNDAVVVVWLSHYGTYTNYITGRLEYGDWGHVVLRDPNHFGQGIPGYYSSPRNGYGGEWFRTIAEVEAAFAASYRFWSEDLNGVRVSAPLTNTAAGAKHAAKRRRKSMSTVYYQTRNDKRAGQGGTGLEWALAGDSPGTDANWLTTTLQEVANDWAESHGNAVFLARKSFKAYSEWYKQPVRTR